jgi:Predicted Fe-S oxidoreductases
MSSHPSGIGSLQEGIRQRILFVRIALHVALRYLGKMPMGEYLRFLRRAATLLRVFRHNRIVRIAQGYKLQLYLPAYPSSAFFAALENKLLADMPASTSVVFSMTRACGNKCPHCYQKTETGSDLDKETLVRTFTDMLGAGVTFFNIEGGEPFLRLDRLNALLEAKPDSAEVWVNTAGKGVTFEGLKDLQTRGMAGIMVSLHSTEAAVHDAFTGVPGSFVLACEALRLAKRVGLGTAINSVLPEQSLRTGGLDALMEMAQGLAADYVQLIHPKPCGGWLEKTDDMQSDKSLLHAIEKAHIRYNSPAMHGYPSLAAQVFEERKAGVGCTAGGIDRFYVTATGEVQPCEFLQFSFGNVRHEKFNDIFSRMRKAYSVPTTGWQCTVQGQAVSAFMRKRGLTSTPITWPATDDFLTECGGLASGKPTPLYIKLKIYEP